MAATGRRERRKVANRAAILAAGRAASGPDAFLEEGFRAFFAFIAADPGTFAFLRRNLGTIRERFGDAVLPAGLGELEADLHDAIARGELPPMEVGRLARAVLAVALELGQELTHSEPPDVEGATRFATALFAGGVGGLARRYAAASCAPASPSS